MCTSGDYNIREVRVYSSSSSATPTPTSTPSSNGISYTYDDNGNMASDGTRCYEYNEANQLSKVKWCSGSVTIAEYVYDYNGLRMVKKNYSNGTLLNTVCSWSDLYETRVTGGTAESTSYYFVNSELIAKKNPDESKYFFHNDHLGSTSVLTDINGNVVETTKYDPWGEVNTGGTKREAASTSDMEQVCTSVNRLVSCIYAS